MRIENTRDAIQRAVALVMKGAAAWGFRRADRADIEIALREALANAAFHGNRGDAAKKILVYGRFHEEKGVRICVRDQGDGFDPEAVPDPREADRLFLHHGRGLFLMRRLMDRVEYRHHGREVVLEKAISSKPRGGGSSARR